MFLAAVLAQGLRHAAIYALGPAWNIRVIVVPERPAVDSGVYRFVRHPNYVAVVVEGFAVPLIHGAWLTALAFSVLNAILLAVRIRCEETALTTHCGYAPLMEGRGRFVPWPLARSSSAHGL